MITDQKRTLETETGELSHSKTDQLLIDPVKQERRKTSLAMHKNQAIVSFRDDNPGTIRSKEQDLGESRTSTKQKETFEVNRSQQRAALSSGRPVNSSSFLSNNTPPIGSGADEQECYGALRSKKNTFMSLKSTGDVDNVLANMNNSTSNQKKYDQYQRLASTEMSYYLHAAAGKKAGAAEIKKSKPINMTPAGHGRPYCRHREFQKMPQYRLETVSWICFLDFCNNLDFVFGVCGAAMHKNKLEVRR